MKIQWFVLFCDWLFLLGIYRSKNTAYAALLFLMIRYIVVAVWASIIYFTVDLEKTPEYRIALNLVCYMLIDSLILFPLQFMRFVF